jgi:DNA-binding LacI/PurR family transcriptional regulator
MVRLSDIAKAAGVSAMTVSRVLRDARDISAATKARVRAIAQQMGYVPDVVAQGLRTRVSKLFGLLIPAMDDPVFARVACAVGERTREQGYDLLVAQTLGKPEHEEAALRRFLARRVDGVFVAPLYRVASAVPVYQELQRRATKVVILGPKAVFCEPFASVEPDNALGAFRATRHLLDLGHRRIAYLAGSPASPVAQQRFEGYKRALREARLELDNHLVFSAGSSMEDGTKAALQMLNESARATAVQAVNDLVAMGAGETLLNQGVRIPQDLSLVGHGNISMSPYFRVPLTTVRQPKAALGATAVEVMLRLLEGNPPETRRLPADLVVRASTAPPCGPESPPAPVL